MRDRVWLFAFHFADEAMRLLLEKCIALTVKAFDILIDAFFDIIIISLVSMLMSKHLVSLITIKP